MLHRLLTTRSRRAREPKIFENRGLESMPHCCGRQVKSHPPCLLLRTAASRSGHSGRSKSLVCRATHLSLLPCTVRSCTPISSLVARSPLHHRHPGDLEGWMTQEPGRSVWEKREERKDSERTTCVISMIPVIFLLLSRRLISLPGGISKLEDLAAEGQTRFPSKNNATSHAGPSQTRTICRTARQRHERSLSLNKQQIGLCTRKFHARAVQKRTLEV